MKNEIRSLRMARYSTEITMRLVTKTGTDRYQASVVGGLSEVDGERGKMNDIFREVVVYNNGNVLRRYLYF